VDAAVSRQPGHHEYGNFNVRSTRVLVIDREDILKFDLKLIRNLEV